MVPENYSEYKKREFCNDIPCFVQIELNKHEQGSEAYENIRRICSAACQFKGQDFEDWLKKNGFNLFKDGKTADFDELKKQGADFSTTWKLHKWMIENKYELGKRE